MNARRVRRLSIALLVTACAAVVTGAGPTTQPNADTRPASPFTFVDVFIDPHGRPLAAYQLELRTTSGDVLLVGIEGGEHKAFEQPPYYDPKALLNEHVVIAALSTRAADALPSAKTRVARLMVRTGAGERPAFDVKLHVAASADAKPVEAAISISEGVAQ